ncbi:hypothetical protein DID78_05595 [Candidatus Marinamargulisbacteria bacterium SCGC AG-343-D04]|nr:hypothetical protein DID78_05595 [Candidatus Marinamargulisbacteria bacterium SCGC AG-343-D04]
MTFDKNAFEKFTIENQVIGIQDSPITLKSGKKSYFYVNWRNITSDVFLLDQCSNFIIDFCKENNVIPDCFYGVPEGASKLGIITQYKWAFQDNCKKNSHILPMGRSKEKLHGAPQDRYFIGQPQGKVILLEDVTTTGQSMLDTLDKLLELKTNVIACIALTNRESMDDDSVKEKVEKRNINYLSLSTAKPLLKQLIEKEPLTHPELKKEIESLR